MFSGKLRHHISEHNWFAVIVDLLVVMAGILLAFQIQSWAENQRNNRLEVEYLFRLKEDIEIEIGQMDTSIEIAQQRIRAVELLNRLLTDPTVVIESHDLLPWALETASWRSFPQINAFVYSELQSSGNLALIRSDSLRRKLANYYTYLQLESRVGLDLDTQHLFERYTAGILTINELVAVENGWWESETYSVDRSRALEIEISFKQRKEAIALLPSLSQHHTFIKKVINEAREQARNILAQIDLLTTEFVDTSKSRATDTDTETTAG